MRLQLSACTASDNIEPAFFEANAILAQLQNTFEGNMFIFHLCLNLLDRISEGYSAFSNKICDHLNELLDKNDLISAVISVRFPYFLFVDIYNGIITEIHLEYVLQYII